MMDIIHAEYIDYRGDYRLYNEKYPQQTIAYEDDLNVARRRVKHELNAKFVVDLNLKEKTNE